MACQLNSINETTFDLLIQINNVQLKNSYCDNLTGEFLEYLYNVHGVDVNYQNKKYYVKYVEQMTGNCWFNNYMMMIIYT